MTAELLALCRTVYEADGRAGGSEDAVVRSGGAVRVLRFDYASAGAVDRAMLASHVTRADLAAVERFALPELRDRALLRRAFVRVALGSSLGIAPRFVPLEKGRRGKPELRGHDRLAVSLSHTDDVVLLALARGLLVGVDVERMAANIQPDLLAPTVLHEEETHLLTGLTGDAQKRAFLRVWCRKEAALKVTGIGLLDDLTSLSVVPEQVRLGACSDPRVTHEDARTVTLMDLALDDAHQSALATTPLR